MRNFLLFLLILSSNLALAKDKIEPKHYQYKIIEVLDGDTVVIEAPYLPDPLPKELSVRINTVDTPEKGGRAHCQSESDLSEKATLFVKYLFLSSKSYTVVFHKWDKFGGRVNGDVFFDGKSLAESLIEKGYAREYHGEKKKSWCDLK